MSALLGRTLLCALTVGLCLNAASQPGGNLKFQRVIAIVPLIGSGTSDDPYRPMFCPSASDLAAATANRQPLPRIACSSEVGDDGKTAIVEFTAMDGHALRAIRQSKVPGVTIYELDAISPAALEAALKAVKASFSLDRFHASAHRSQLLRR
jgi:hypothetical protein